MKNTLLEIKNFGTAEHIIYVYNLIEKHDCSYLNLKKVCVSFSNSIEGIVFLLLKLSFIKQDNKLLQVNYNNKLKLDEIFFNRLFDYLLYENIFYELFAKDNLFIEENDLFINNSLINLNFAHIRNLLLNLNFFEKDQYLYNTFKINTRYVKTFLYFHNTHSIKPNNYTLEMLKQENHRREQLGMEAEKFILFYELERLEGHINYKMIRIISDDNVSAGYDIESFNSKRSLFPDRFIEVKSFSGTESFFWSRNEIDVAKIKENEYFLYLVDISKINNKGYKPTIIQNPYEQILSNDRWNKRIEKYFIQIQNV